MKTDKISVSELMTLMKVVRGRVSQLQNMQIKCSTKETYYGDAPRVVDPEYDIKLLDKKINQLNTFLFLADSKIKKSNAVTEVNLDVDVDVLLSSIE